MSDTVEVSSSQRCMICLIDIIDREYIASFWSDCRDISSINSF